MQSTLHLSYFSLVINFVFVIMFHCWCVATNCGWISIINTVLCIEVI